MTEEDVQPRPWRAIHRDIRWLGWETLVREVLEAKTDDERRALIADVPPYRFTIAERREKRRELRAPDPETGKPKLTQEETAKLLGVSERTVREDERTGRTAAPDGERERADESPTGSPSRDAALSPEQRAREEQAARLARWSKRWSTATRALSELEYEVADGMTQDQRERARADAAFLRHIADKVEDAVTSSLRVVKGGKG